MRNTLHYGENLDILREHIPEESIDLIYLNTSFKRVMRHRNEEE